MNKTSLFLAVPMAALLWIGSAFGWDDANCESMCRRTADRDRVVHCITVKMVCSRFVGRQHDPESVVIAKSQGFNTKFAAQKIVDRAARRAKERGQRLQTRPARGPFQGY